MECFVRSEEKVTAQSKVKHAYLLVHEAMQAPSVPKVQNDLFSVGALGRAFYGRL